MSDHFSVGASDFARMFGVDEERFPAVFNELLRQTRSDWRMPTSAEMEVYLLDVLKKINEQYSPRTTDENLEAFEKGWTENLDAMKEKGISIDSLRPRYFRHTKYLRYDKTLVVSDNADLEHDLFVLARHLIFSKYLEDFPVIYEFGCGSCANLLMLSDLFPDKRLVGLDWARSSVEIADFLGNTGGRKVSGRIFDLLNPDDQFAFEPDAAVLTVHALEQLGDRFGPWLDFLLRTKPGLVVNYEPVMEFYDPDNLWDYLAILYSRKRGYLTGYVAELRRLAEQGRVEILEERRPCLGGVFHEASLVVWKPL